MTTISCIRCKAPKDVTEFDSQKLNKSGVRQPCKSCRHEKEYLPRAGKMKTDSRQQYADSQEFRTQKIEYAKKQYKEDPELKKEQARKSALKCLYKMTVEEYAAKSKAQDYKCLICGRRAEEADPRRKDLCVDHDHSCCPGPESCGNCIRGLICSQCNNMLGHAQDDPEVLQAGIEYLRSFKPKICVVA